MVGRNCRRKQRMKYDERVSKEGRRKERKRKIMTC
jgi:hypothetical protein